MSILPFTDCYNYNYSVYQIDCNCNVKCRPCRQDDFGDEYHHLIIIYVITF